MTVIQASEKTVVERNVHGRVDTTIGCIDTGRAELNITVSGDQIDLTVNPTQLATPTGPGTLVGPARPAFQFDGTDFWAQGINFGMELRY